MSQALLIPGVGRLNLQRLLFGAGEVGGIYDWSDRSTMFQDVAGTQPITASGQTRALHLDKSRGLVRGAELLTPSSGPYGSIPAFMDNATASNTLLSVSEGNIRYEITAEPATSRHMRVFFTAIVGRFYEVQATINSNFGFNLAAPVGMTPAIGAVASGSRTVRAIVSATAVNTFFRIYPRGPSSEQLVGDFLEISSFSVRELPGNHRYQANLASRPQYIEDETGHYGLFDGIDDFDETNAVDFTGTDKMTVWWGGRKLSDAAVGNSSGAIGRATGQMDHFISSASVKRNSELCFSVRCVRLRQGHALASTAFVHQ
jgi:hypothetical protein